MALYRFLFAPVLLAVAVFAGNGEDRVAPAAPPAAARAAPALAAEPAAPAPAVAERASPEGATPVASRRVRAAR